MSSTLAFNSKEGTPINTIFSALDNMANAHPKVHFGTYGRKISICLSPTLEIPDTANEKMIVRRMGDYTYLHTIIEANKPIESILKEYEGISHHGICAQSRFDTGGDIKYERNLWILNKVAFALNGLVYYWYKTSDESEKCKSRLKKGNINCTDDTDGLAYSLYLAEMYRQKGEISRHDLITRPVILDMNRRTISAYCYLTMTKTKDAYQMFGMDVPEDLSSLGIYKAEDGKEDFVISGKIEGAKALLPNVTPKIMVDGETFTRNLH